MSGCSNTTAVEEVIGRPPDNSGACIVTQLPPGAYAVKVVDANGDEGNVLASVNEDVDGGSSNPGNSEVPNGVREGGDIIDEDPFYACINVAGEGNTISIVGSECLKNNKLNSAIVASDAGTSNSGAAYSVGFATIANIPIVNNSFSYEFRDGTQIGRISGTFSGETVTGTASVESTLFFVDGKPVGCSNSWSGEWQGVK